MGLFRFRSSRSPLPSRPRADGIPIAQVDIDRRYDVYCSVANEERLYEDVKFIGIRTFDRITEFSPGYVHGYLELEAADGSRWMIPTFGIQLICEHGVQPGFRVLRRWGNSWDY